MNLLKSWFRGSRIPLLLWMLCFTFIVNAQVNIRGRVIDSNNESLMGVTVAIKTANTGTITDTNGNFSLTVPNQKSVLIFSFVGYKKQEITVGNNTQFTVKMVEDTELLEEVVVVGYGTQKKVSVTGSISQISGSEMLKSPTSNLSQMLGGRITGLVTRQSSGVPGSDDAAMIIRGIATTSGASAPAIIVDGVQRSFNQLDPNEIESISVLKDAAAAAVYGIQGANGVILVTTKKGSESKSKISYSGSIAMNENTNFPTFMDGPQYAYYWNKALEMDGKSAVFTKDMVDKMINGDADGVYGNTNWVDQIFQTGYTQHHNISASGGTKDIKYYLMVGHYNQKGNIKNFDFSRFNVRANIEANVAKGLTANLNIAGRKEDRDRPYFGAGKNDYMSIIQQAIRAHPYVPMTYNGLPTATKTASAQVSPIAARDVSGFNQSELSVFQSNFSLNWQVPGVKGLTAKAMASFDRDYTHSKVFKTPYKVSLASRPTTTSPNLTYSTMNPVAIGTEATMSEGFSEATRFTFQGQINYARTFNKHDINALALWEQSERGYKRFGVNVRGFDFYDFAELNHAQQIATSNQFSGSSNVQPRAGFVFRGSYAFDQKYLVELSGRYDGSYRFSPETRWALFPALSLGWRVSEEEFFNDALPFITNFKLRASAGQLGNDAASPAYAYLRYVDWVSDKPSVVIGNAAQRALMTSGVPSNNTWEVTTSYNGGFDLSMWHGLLGVEFDWFYKLTTGILRSQAGIWPPSVGGNFPSVINSGKVDSRGFDLLLSHENKINDFSYGTRLSLNWARNRILNIDDSPNIPDYLKRNGLQVGMKDGFEALGLFRTDEDAATYPTVREGAQAGDIQYKDQNGDGKITYDQDRAWVGRSNVPELMGGLDLHASWKGFDISVLFSGAAFCDVALMGWYDGVGWDNTEFTRSFYHDGNSPLYLVQNSWTYDNTSAKFPRLSTISRPNNGWASTFWFVDGSYLRVKNMQIGYSIPSNITKAIGIFSARLSISGSNLFTWANE
ncbi:MAG: TonB-dependent receptor, partial [Paludibacter sp.]|nr:TonB-dependent receptor [Paludibacter sp.]